MCEALRGWRHVRATERRTRTDRAWCTQELCDVHYPQARKIILVEDNLNAHNGTSLYETLLPEKAGRLLDRREFPSTSKHGSWLDMAELESGILNRQSVVRRIDNAAGVARHVAAWEADRNERQSRVPWTFTIATARGKLKKLHPSIKN